MWVVAVPRAALWAAGLPAKTQAARRRRRCDACVPLVTAPCAFVATATTDALCMALGGFADARTECARPTGTREVYRGLSRTPVASATKQTRAGCSIFSHRPRHKLDSGQPRAAKVLSRTVETGAEAALARPHTKRTAASHHCAAHRLHSRRKHSAPSSPLAR